MEYINPNARMICRSAEEYDQLALTGCVSVAEPAAWAGWDRRSADGFGDYFDQLTTVEPSRAAHFGICHYTYLGLSPRDGENRALAREVIQRIPHHLERPTVVGIGPIGLNRNTRNELETFKDQVALALEHDQLIMVQTPALEDKYKGTKLIIRALWAFQRLDPRRVVIDCAEEHTVEMIRGNGFQCGIALDSAAGVSYSRAVDMIEVHGTRGIHVSSACDPGNGVRCAIPHLIQEMRRRQHCEHTIRAMVHDNPAAFLSQCPKFHLRVEPVREPAKVVA